MLHLHPLAAAEGVDAAEPIRHPGEQLQAVAAAHQKLPVQPDVLGPALGDHGVHIRQKAVHAVLPAEIVGLFPKLRRGIAQSRDKGVVLHIRGAQGLVKVIQQGHDGVILPPPCR